MANMDNGSRKITLTKKQTKISKTKQKQTNKQSTTERRTFIIELLYTEICYSAL